MITHQPNAAPIDPSNLLEIDGDTFLKYFNAAPFLVKHNLADNVLFCLHRLMHLAQTLPERSVEYNAGTLPINGDPEKTPRNGLSIQETIKRIEECNSWMVLKYVEQDAEYRALLHACLGEVKRQSKQIIPKMSQAEAFIFLSSPGAITPYHMDPEHNFLLQIRGEKFITVFDRALVPQQLLEDFYWGAHRNLPFDASWKKTGTTFQLRNGDGVHVPVEAPHYVRNGEQVSVSFSITFRTPDLDRRSSVNIVNKQLRNMGVPARPVGESLFLDAAKNLSYRAYRKVRNVLGSPR